MSDTNVIILFNAIFLGVLVLLFKNFLPSYFNEKGKNLATKEDIQGITKIVEDVKLSNNKALELIKIELGLVSKAQGTIYDDERKAIIDFFAAITSFYRSNIHIPNESTTPDGADIIREEIRNLEHDYRKLHIAHSNLLLFCFNEEVLTSAKPIMSSLTQIKGQTQKYRFEFLGQTNMIVLLREQSLKDPSSTDIDKKMEALYAEQLAVHKTFNAIDLDFYRAYKPIYDAHLNLCKHYLQTRKVSL